MTEELKKDDQMALHELADGQWARIKSLDLPVDVQNQLMHMGFMPDAPVIAIRRAPAGDPTVYGIDGSEVALRRETARWIVVEAFLPTPSASLKELPS